METPICLNPEAPLFIPSLPHPYFPSYILEIPTQEFHFPMINLNFPPPPAFPAYPPPLYHQNYTHYCSIPPPPPLLPPPPPPKLLSVRISSTHKLNILPSLPKLVPPPLLLPPSPPHQRQPPFYTDLNLPKSYPPSPQSPPLDFYTIPLSVTAVSVQEALTPMTSGPRFPKKKRIVPRASSRKKEQPPLEEKEYNNNDKPASRLVDSRIFRERKVGGSHKFVVPAKKKSDKRKTEIIPLKEEEEKTTVMIKNIPNQHTREMLMQFLDQHCNVVNGRADQDLDSCEGEEREGNIVSAYDFLYLPIDFGSRLNKGYAFVNFTHPEAVWKFYDAFNGKSWDLFKSPKIIEIVCANIQGKETLVSHFEGSNFHCESDEFLPVWFDPPRDGLGESVKLQPVGNRHSTPKRNAALKGYEFTFS